MTASCFPDLPRTLERAQRCPGCGHSPAPRPDRAWSPCCCSLPPCWRLGRMQVRAGPLGLAQRGRGLAPRLEFVSRLPPPPAAAAAGPPSALEAGSPPAAPPAPLPASVPAGGSAASAPDAANPSAAFVSSGPVVISEVQSSNKQTIKDEDGASPDWLELFNSGTDAVSLAVRGTSWALRPDLGAPLRARGTRGACTSACMGCRQLSLCPCPLAGLQADRPA